MDAKALVDLAIEDNPHVPMPWLPSRLFPAFCSAIRQEPNIVGAVIHRNKTIRDCGSVTDIVTRKP
jgi:hypothetical protein